MIDYSAKMCSKEEEVLLIAMVTVFEMFAIMKIWFPVK